MAVIKSDDFTNLDNWTITQTTGTITASGNKMIIDSTSATGGWQTLGAVYNESATAVADGYLFKFIFNIESTTSAHPRILSGPNTKATLDFNGPSTSQIYSFHTDNSFGAMENAAYIDPVISPDPSLNTDYTFRFKFRDSGGTLFCDSTVQGGSEWPAETAVSSTPAIDWTGLSAYMQYNNYGYDVNIVNISSFEIHDSPEASVAEVYEGISLVAMGSF